VGEGTPSPIPCPRPDFAVAAKELLAALMLDDTAVEWPTREAGAGARPECRNEDLELYAEACEASAVELEREAGASIVADGYTGEGTPV
jgi:hypothetical protein